MQNFYGGFVNVSKNVRTLDSVITGWESASCTGPRLPDRRGENEGNGTTSSPALCVEHNDRLCTFPKQPRTFSLLILPFKENTYVLVFL